MKRIINKVLLFGAALGLTIGAASCVGDLDQLPKDPNSMTANRFKENPREYLGEVMAKCYSSLAVSGQSGPNGVSDISGLDGGTSQYSRCIFMLECMPTDECIWLYDDGGVDDLRWATWGSTNVAIFGAYSRLYVHIAVCNDFIRLANNAADYGVTIDESFRPELDQMVREARALRDLSYYYVIDLFGNGVYAWDTQSYGTTPNQMKRAELYRNVVNDLEDVLANFQESGVYGRIGKDAVEGLLCKFYLNGEVYTGAADFNYAEENEAANTQNCFSKCWEHADNIIKRHTGTGFMNSGLANDQLALFCGSNKMFCPGGELYGTQGEILWGIPQQTDLTEPWGGSTFLVNAAIKNMAASDFDIVSGAASIEDGYMNQNYYGTIDSWGCMHARKEFADKFSFVNGYSGDGRTYLWLTEHAGFTKENIPYNEFIAGYACSKFTAVDCDAQGNLPRFQDPVTGLNRVGLHKFTNQQKDSYQWQQAVLTNQAGRDFSAATHHNTNVPVIRLADVYLMAAEAALNNATALNGATAPSKSLATQYVNYIRQRAGVPTWNESELTLSSLLDERARELYWENCRRSDLVRHGKFTSGYTWAWKGHVENGTSLPSHFNLYPIPANVIAVYGSSMEQNTGY